MRGVDTDAILKEVADFPDQGIQSMLRQDLEVAQDYTHLIFRMRDSAAFIRTYLHKLEMIIASIDTGDNPDDDTSMERQ